MTGIDPALGLAVTPAQRAVILAWAKHGAVGWAEDIAALCRDSEKLEARVAALTTERDEASAALDELVAPDPGKPLPQRIRDEFADFQMILEHCTAAYMHLSDGRISKPNTLPSAVCGLADDLETERQDKAVTEALEAQAAIQAALVAALEQAHEELFQTYGLRTPRVQPLLQEIEAALARVAAERGAK